MYKFYTKEFSESLFETIADWLNEYANPAEGKTYSQHHMVIIDYTIIPGYSTQGARAIITIRVFEEE